MADSKDNKKLVTRRNFMQKAGLLALTVSPLGGLAAKDTGEGVTFADGPRPLVRYPGKRDLIRVHTRPPHLETPFSAFNEGVITPNDAFFVRYHLSNFPKSIDPETYRLTVKGKVETVLNLSLVDLKSIAEQVEVVAVNQCSGNSRGYSSPRVFGAQLGNGAMGNARWTGVPLRAVLEKAGVLSDAKYVTFDGIDKPVFRTTPDFRKSLDIEHALTDEPLIAWGMNGEELPFLNGYPIKLIVPGYFGTYWVKHLSEIELLDHPFEGHDSFFMTEAYRLPDNDCLCVTPGSVAAKTLPISLLPVRSFITSVVNDDIVPINKKIVLKGITFDGGSGHKSVDVSVDGGKTWQEAKMGEDLGRFSFQEWQLSTTFDTIGPATLMVRAKNNQGEIQPATATWNHGGYRRHVIESTLINIV